MFANWSRLVRLGLVLSIGLFVMVRPLRGHISVAWADGDDDDDSAGDDDDDGGGGDDSAGDDDDDDAEQPAVTAGGLFTKDTYPVGQLQRPLTMTGGMTQLRLGIDMDVSAKTAFDTFGLGLDAKHGIADNVELQADFRTRLNNFSGAGNDRGKLTFKAAIEAGIV